MSAFICTDKHISTIVLFLQNCIDGNNTGNPQLIADILKRENIKSVNYRYNEKTRFKACDLTQAVKTYSGNDILQGIDCLEYQSCEHPEYYNSMAFAFCAMARALLEVKGYNKEFSLVWTL